MTRRAGMRVGMDWVDGSHKRDLLLGRVKNRHSVCW